MDMQSKPVAKPAQIKIYIYIYIYIYINFKASLQYQLQMVAPRQSRILNDMRLFANVLLRACVYIQRRSESDRLRIMQYKYNHI